MQLKSRRILITLITLIFCASLFPTYQVEARGRGGGGGSRGGGSSRVSGGGGRSRSGASPRVNSNVQLQNRGNVNRSQGSRQGSRDARQGTRQGTRDTRQGERQGTRDTRQGTRQGTRDTRQSTRQGNIENRQGNRDTRQGNRQDSIDNRQGNRQDNRENRQGNRQDNIENRQDSRLDNRENRQNNRQDFIEDNYYGGGWYGGGWYGGGYYVPPGWGAWATAVGFTTGLVIGAAVSEPPPYYSTVYVGDTGYIYSEGVFFESSGDSYVVIAPPVGAVVTYLPEGCTTIETDDGLYYNCSDIYYQPFYQNGTTVYQVVEF